MSRLREGRANTARGAPTSCVRRWGGCATAGPGDNSRCGPTAASTPTLSRFSITIRQRASLRDLIAIPEEDWTPIPYWVDGAADVAETTYTPFQTKPERRCGSLSGG